MVGEGQDCLELRASSDHCFIVGALRAHETVLPLHPLPSFCIFPIWHVVTQRVALFFSLFVPLSLWWLVVFFGQVAGLGQTARVQRGPVFGSHPPALAATSRRVSQQAARCASNGTALLPAHPLLTPAALLLSSPLLFRQAQLFPNVVNRSAAFTLIVLP